MSRSFWCKHQWSVAKDWIVWCTSCTGHPGFSELSHTRIAEHPKQSSHQQQSANTISPLSSIEESILTEHRPNTHVEQGYKWLNIVNGQQSNELFNELFSKSPDCSARFHRTVLLFIKGILRSNFANFQMKEQSELWSLKKRSKHNKQGIVQQRCHFGRVQRASAPIESPGCRQQATRPSGLTVLK